MNKVIRFENPDYYASMDLFKIHKHGIEEAGAQYLLEIFKDWYPNLRIKGNNDGLETELKDCTYFGSPYTTAKSWAREMLERIRDKGFQHELLEVGPPVVTMHPMASGDRCFLIGVNIMVTHSKAPLITNTTSDKFSGDTCDIRRNHLNKMLTEWRETLTREDTK